MAKVPGTSWDLPAIHVILIWILLLLFIITIIIWLLTSRRGKGDKEEHYESDKATVISCPGCHANVEVTTSQRPVRVECDACGEETMVR